ncbi:hypothetical protein D6C93_10456 [Aureobasidium pullulans]|nr:hypothetical protein D6C93_10456 [Aureobasidium pullulans]
MANTRPPDLATCEMLRKLMKSARDDHLTDPQIQFLSGTVTSANVEHNIKLLHKANKEKANKDKADKEKANKDEAQPRNPRPTVAQHGSAIKRQEHSLLYKHTLPVPSEAGAVICADTFERLNTEDIRALHKLINVCPFNLASQTCVHAKDCYLVRICSNDGCTFGGRCRGSHDFKSTCQSVLESKQCDHEAEHGTKCPKNHDYKARLFMSAMRKPHELGFYSAKVQTLSFALGSSRQMDTRCQVTVIDGNVQDF